jgi:hypothetical protein
MIRLSFAACVLWWAPVVSGQALCVTVSPNPAPLGVPITVSGYAASPYGLYTPNGCWVQSVRSGTPGGPIVQTYGCIQIPVPIPGCGTASPRTTTWNQTDINAAQVPPGLYWFQIPHTSQPFGGPTTEWHCATISGPTPVPVLSAPTTAFWGVPFQLTINATTHPNEFYGIALSGSTNVGLSIGPGLFVCLDQDAILNLTFPSPHPSYFYNFQGLLDSSGVGVGVILIPSFGGCFPVHAQAGLIDAAQIIYLSNEIAFTII